MKHTGSPLAQIGVILPLAFHRLGVKAAEALRLRPKPDPPISLEDFQARLREVLKALPQGVVEEYAFYYLPGDRPPWTDTKIDLDAGEEVTTIAAGRVYLSRFFDVFVEPQFQLWSRVGEEGPIFNGTRNTNTFRAESKGPLHLAGVFPGEWGDPSGKLGTPEKEFKGVQGGMSVLVIRWKVDALRGLKQMAAQGDVESLIAGEIERLENPPKQPEGWNFLWFLGRSEIYRDAAEDDDGRKILQCRTHKNVSIIQHDAEMPLTPDVRLQWSWKVDELPSERSEITVPTHDYMSIAVEFDNGQDLTYYWSATLPPETVYRCPLPTWKDRETHVVIRSGREGLGQWLDESRSVHADCLEAYGEAPAKIVRVWLIANSLLQRKHGACDYADIRLVGNGNSFTID